MKHGVLVVHGIGQQKPGDTLSGFAKGWYDTAMKMLKEGGHDPAELRVHPRFSEGYVDFSYRGEEWRVKEVVWSTIFRPPSRFKMLGWLWKVAGTRPQHPAARSARPLTAQVVAPFRVGLVLMGAIWIASKIPFKAVYSAPLNWSSQRLNFLIVDVFGDVMVYVDDDWQSLLIKQTLQEDVEYMTSQYHADTIHIVGHSLGSVIAFEVLSTSSWNLTKVPIKTFFSVGSPLDKIRYFFGHLPRFGSELSTEIEWYNIRARHDPVAATIDFYKPGPREDIEVVHDTNLFIGLVREHTNYWNSPKAMGEIIRATSHHPDFSGQPPLGRPSVPYMFIQAGGGTLKYAAQVTAQVARRMPRSAARGTAQVARRVSQVVQMKRR